MGQWACARVPADVHPLMRLPPPPLPTPPTREQRQPSSPAHPALGLAWVGLALVHALGLQRVCGPVREAAKIMRGH